MLHLKAYTTSIHCCLWAFVCLAFLTVSPAFAFQSSTYICDALDAVSDDPVLLRTADSDLPTIVPKYKRDYFEQRKDYVDPRNIPQLVTPALERMGFTEVSKIAHGGMGTVFRAKKDGKNVILKILHDEVNHLESFEHEAAVMNRLHSVDSRFPKADRFNFLGEDGKPFRAMEIEFIPKRPGSDEPAGTLAELLKDGAYWQRNPDARASIRRQYNSLLLKAHRQGISHYDVKPANILISFDEKGEPVVHVIDWGMASQLSDSGFLRSPAVRNGDLFGTLGYISQRRLRGGAPNEEDDVYAARIIDWHLRNSQNGMQGPMVVRHLSPSGKPKKTNNPEDVASTVLRPEAFDQMPPTESAPRPDAMERDSSGFYGQFKEPAHAMDIYGTEKERMMAAAEFSLIPKTIVEREQLIVAAKVLHPKVFLQQMGQKLSAMAEPDLRPEGTKPNMTIEILSSTVLVDNFDTRSGLRLSKEDIAAVARTAAAYYNQTRKFAVEPSQLGWYGPHHDYHYHDLGHKIDELAAAGITKPWKEWLAETK